MRISLCILLVTVALGTGGRAGDKPDIDKELKKFHGTWTFSSVETGGKEEPIDLFKGMTVTFEGDKYTVKKDGEVVQVGRQKLDPSKAPKTLDATLIEGVNKGAVMLGIYEFSGDTLKVCFDAEGKKRPSEFKTAAATQTLVVHKRVQKR